MTLLLAIIGHLIGDYLLQNDWMALNKKQKDLPCAVHCFIWAMCVWGCTHLDKVGPGWPTIVLPVLFVLHYIQDRTTLIVYWMTRINTQEKFVYGPCAPWSVIVVDNVWHIVTLLAVWRIL